MALLVNHSCEAAEKFVDLYYKTMDKNRHLIGKLYLDISTLVWNGNESKGQEAIQKYYEALPPSDHNIEAIDAHTVPDVASNGSSMIIVTTAGTVKYQTHQPTSFNQTFMLMNQEQGKSWKVVSDSVRTSE